MTRFEKIKTDLTVEEYADQNRFALKCNNCRKHQPGVFGACTFADCRKETIRYLNEEVEICTKAKIPVFMKNSLVPIMGEDNMLREMPEGLMK